MAFGESTNPSPEEARYAIDVEAVVRWMFDLAAAPAASARFTRARRRSQFS